MNKITVKNTFTGQSVEIIMVICAECNKHRNIEMFKIASKVCRLCIKNRKTAVTKNANNLSYNIVHKCTAKIDDMRLAKDLKEVWE